MFSDKARLYVALCVRNPSDPRMPHHEDEYHWALIVGPREQSKEAQGILYHVKDHPPVAGQGKWNYESIEDYKMKATGSILVRVLVAKVINHERVESVLGKLPFSSTDPECNCVTWIEQALKVLDKDKKALGPRVMEWTLVRDIVLKYMRGKSEAHYFDDFGPNAHLPFYERDVPTWDMLEQEEIAT